MSYKYNLHIIDAGTLCPALLCIYTSLECVDDGITSSKATGAPVETSSPGLGPAFVSSAVERAGLTSRK